MNLKAYSLSLVLCSLITSLPAVAETTDASASNPNNNAIDERAHAENKAINNPFVISLYQPTYILPLYYTGNPDTAAYANNTPANQAISNSEIKFQFSFKVPIVSLDSKNRLYAAYTQLSYWQAYENSPFFRETDYQPEIFLAHQINYPLLWNWKLNFINPGLVHQSNGRGGSEERSWNRAYLDFIAADDNWMANVEPWYIFNDHSLNTYNPDIAHYLGRGEVWVSYKLSNTVFSLMLRNQLESTFSRGTEELDWSFPLTTHFRGYIQLFSGYGQSLIEYNHYTNSAGIGFSLSDWI